MTTYRSASFLVASGLSKNVLEGVLGRVATAKNVLEGRRMVRVGRVALRRFAKMCWKVDGGCPFGRVGR